MHAPIQQGQVSAKRRVMSPVFKFNKARMEHPDKMGRKIRGAKNLIPIHLASTTPSLHVQF
jgi:hypothetical protein